MKVSGSSTFLVREAKEGGAGGWKVSLKVNTGKAELVRSRRLSMIHILLGYSSGQATELVSHILMLLNTLRPA